MDNEMTKFCPVSLGDWMKLCERINVPAVAAKQIADVRKMDYLNWTDEGEVRERLMAAYSQIREFAASDYMVRYDCCGSSEIKYALAHGNYEWHEDFSYLMLDDPRAYAIIEEYPREVVPVWQRPWVKSKIVGKYPVEYRVFVRNGEIVGISNYYPQRPLPFVIEHIDTIRTYTVMLINELKGVPFEWHTGIAFLMGRDKLDLDKIHFSADFLVDENDEVLFLEGGPPHEMGAHECCFEEGNINGLALSNGKVTSHNLGVFD